MTTNLTEDKIRTTTIYVKNKDYCNIFNYITKISKNVYNSAIYCITIFNKYSNNIFEQIFKDEIAKQIELDKNIPSNHEPTEEEILKKLDELKLSIEKQFYDKFNEKYNEYQIIKKK